MTRPNLADGRDASPGVADPKPDETAEAALKKLRPYLKPEKAGEAKLVLTRMVSKFHSGPIPPAEEMERLEQVLPGAANRCFELAEREQRHRHHVDETVIAKEFILRTTGQWLALLALILLLLVIGWIAYLGDTHAAAWLGGVTIVAVVSIFATGRLLEKGDMSKDDSQQAERTPARLPKKQAAGRRR